MRKRIAFLVGLPLIILSSAGIVTIIGAQESPRAGAATGAFTPGYPPAAAAESAFRVRLAKDGERTAEAQLNAAGEGQAGRSVPASAGGTGAAPEVAYYPDRVYRGAGTLYRVSDSEGVLASSDGGVTWAVRISGLPLRSVYPFDRQLPPLITSFAVDPINDQRVVLTLPDSVFLSENGGESWDKIGVKEPLKPNDQLTAVALNPANPAALMVGTSFDGMFETLDRGKTWTDLSKKIGFMYLGGGSYEEIDSIAYDPSDPSLAYFSLGFGKGLYSLKKGDKSATQVDFPGDQSHAPIVDISFHRTADAASPAWIMEVRTDDARWVFDPGASSPSGTGTGAWRIADIIHASTAPDPAKAERAAKASGKYGLYISSIHAGGKLLDGHIAFCKANGLNSMVVDFKDDFGFVTYDTDLETPKRIGAVKKRFTTEEVVGKAHANGLYLIARIVVFRDRQLYNADDFAYAVWDRAAGKPWRYFKTTVDSQTGEETSFQGEYWVDPYSEKVWKYNVDIALELEARGVDEIQFDYIRFPSDGDLSRISYRSRRQGMGKIEALESFLAMARESLRIPISTDVYGYCGWARVSNWVAQNIEVFSRYVDVISPMYYPSHFPRDFLGSMQYIPRAGYIYREGPQRASRIVAGRSVIRPYVQAFRIGGELKFGPPVYTSYLMSQVQGVLASAASGFTLWNASNDYYMVTASLAPYTVSSVGSAAAPAVGVQ